MGRLSGIGLEGEPPSRNELRFMPIGSENREHWSITLGSAGCQPAVCGSLPQTMNLSERSPFAPRAKMHSARRPNAAGWQPALPRVLRARAFTLLEIMLAVMILGMMALVIYR